MPTNPIFSTIDYEKGGIQHGFLQLPYSRNDSAWGSIMLPITQIKNGLGATALLTGGNHGDEYEGPIALHNLAARESYKDVHGRIIVIPAMNYPAFLSGDRVSPIDGINMNRTYPGRPKGSVTEVIADYFSQTLIPMADFVLDIHSGGKTLNFLPLAASHELDDKDLEIRCAAAMHAFGAPYQLKMLEIDATGMYDTQVESMNKVFVTTELGGGGSSNTETVAIAKRGVNNFLIHSGILEGEINTPYSNPINLNMPDNSCFLFSQHSGLIEPCVDLGDTVNKGQLIARIHDVNRTAAPIQDYFSPREGLVITKYFPSLIKIGDCISVIAEIN